LQTIVSIMFNNLLQPFPLDYFQVTISVCDVLIEIYHKIRHLAGSSPLQHSGMAYSVPPGSGYAISVQSPTTTNNPIFNQLFTPTVDPSGQLFGSETPVGSYVSPTGGLTSPPASWSPSLAESIVKVDSRFKVSKLLVVLGFC